MCIEHIQAQADLPSLLLSPSPPCPSTWKRTFHLLCLRLQVNTSSPSLSFVPSSHYKNPTTPSSTFESYSNLQFHLSLHSRVVEEKEKVSQKLKFQHCDFNLLSPGAIVRTISRGSANLHQASQRMRRRRVHLISHCHHYDHYHYDSCALLEITVTP